MTPPAFARARTVILLSPQFAPSPLAGVHRARHLAKHLPAHGWKPIVIRTDERCYVERLDPALAALVPASVEQVRTGALDAALARHLGVGDLGLRGYGGFSRAIDETVARASPSVVFITGFPFYPMLLAKRISQRHGLPVVLDFQDPWVSAFGAAQPWLSKAGLAHRLAVMLEPRAVRHAAFITGVSQIQNDQIADRYPWLDRQRMAALPIGGDPADFPPPTAATQAKDGEAVTLRYIGAYWPRAEPGLRQLFRGLALLRQTSPDIARRIRLSFVGTNPVNQAGEAPVFPVADLARQEGVSDQVEESPQRAPFVEALGLMSNAAALLVIGSDEPHYSPSKIYPTLMSGRPYLSLMHRDSNAHAILSAAGGGCVLGFGSLEDLATMTPAIAEGLAQLVTNPAAFGHADPAAYAPYTAHAIAGRFAEIFESVAR